MVEVKCPTCGTIKEILGTEKRVRCSSNACTNRFYVNIDTIVPEKRTEKDSIGTHQYRTTARNKGRDITIEIDYNIILKCMDRAISSIRNKKEVKEKRGAYYFDYLAWTREFEKMKLLEMGDEK